MGIQHRIDINRVDAIGRIRNIFYLINSKDYKGLEAESLETDYNIKEFIDTCEDNTSQFVDNFTNEMLEDVIDLPYFRTSKFVHYQVLN